jgi:radical SAM superfamily enzyme YgiQ (UPF0313 family)
MEISDFKIGNNPRVLLLYPPNQTWPGYMCKPNGSLAYPSMAGALIEAGVEVDLFDACVGNEKDDLDDFFYDSEELPSGLLRTGVSEDRMLEVVKDFDIIGLTSIFSDQETMVLSTSKSIKKHYPEKLIISGGVNARNRISKFLSNGIDIVFLSESEKTIINLVNFFSESSPNLDKLSSMAFKSHGKTITRPTLPDDVVWDLDQLPMPAWNLLPNEKYWEIGRPHGGHFEEGEELKYASLMTSLGCPFSCTYCHIAGEKSDSVSGDIGQYRIKSDDRVLKELYYLKDVIGVKQVFVEDDSIFGKKKRGIRLLNKVLDVGLEILDVNGVNIIHLLKKGKPDHEVIELLVKAGFREIVLPFESANQRIIKKYASNKWILENSDIKGLIRVCKEYGLRVPGNFMLGFPDETREEIENTIEFAKKCLDWGLDSANFFLTMPLPGTPLFDDCVRDGYLPKDYNPDKMNWTKANMKNTLVPPEELEEIRQRAWEDTNDPEFVKYKLGMNVS